MENFELVPLKNGLMSLRALEPRETFHPGMGPRQEAKLLHVQQQQIVERSQKTDEYVIWDVGLGAAANALSAVEALENIETPVVLHSFDKTISPLLFAIENAHELKYLEDYLDPLKALLKNGEVKVGKNISWKLHLGDFSKNIENINLRSPDSIFYDPYSPVGNPEMWTLSLFSKLRAKLDNDRACLWSNYTRSTLVRVSLLLAGFYVGVGCGLNEKEETTLASNKPEMIQNPLGLDWLQKRVRASHSAAPLRGNHYEVAPLSSEDYEQLLTMPQFSMYQL